MNAFRNRYQSAFGTQPQQLAALAYDATALVAIVARDLGDRDFSSATLTDPEGFSGATGLFRLRPAEREDERERIGDLDHGKVGNESPKHLGGRQTEAEESLKRRPRRLGVEGSAVVERDPFAEMKRPDALVVIR